MHPVLFGRRDRHVQLLDEQRPIDLGHPHGQPYRGGRRPAGEGWAIVRQGDMPEGADPPRG